MSYEAWRISFQSSEQAARSAYNDFVKLNSRIAELEKDAARYRWLRGNCQEVGDCYGAYGQLYFGTYGLGELDSEIDEAMSREA